MGRIIFHQGLMGESEVSFLRLVSGNRLKNGWKASGCAPWSLFRRDNCRVSVWLQRLPFVRANVLVDALQTASTHHGSRQKPSSENRWWGGITPPASVPSACLSPLWKGRIYWIPERAFSPSPALSAAWLEMGLHYRWAPGSRHTLTALRLPPVDAQRHSTWICTNMQAPSKWTLCAQCLISLRNHLASLWICVSLSVS